MSLERRGKTLGINNWKFNQGGFKDGGRRACGDVLFSNRGGCKIQLLRVLNIPPQ